MVSSFGFLLRKRNFIVKFIPCFCVFVYFFAQAYYFVYLQSFQQFGGSILDQDLESLNRGKCSLVLSSYVWLPANERLKVDEYGSLMHLLCTYVHNIINSQENIDDFRLIGWNSKIKFEGFVSKVRAIKALADSLQADTILMMTDAFDVLIQKQISCTHVKALLLGKYKGKMVFVGERQCYPLSRKKYAKGEACKDYPTLEGDIRSRHLNGGSWVGFAQDVSSACELFLENFHSWKKKHFRTNDYHRIVSKLPSIQNSAGQDQYGFAIMYLYGKAKIIAVDTLSEFFITSSGYLNQFNSSRTITTPDGLQFDTVTSSIPAIIHYNAGKRAYLHSVRLLPWVNNKVSSMDSRNFTIALGPDLDTPSVIHIEFADLCPGKSFINVDDNVELQKSMDNVTEKLYHALNKSFTLSIFETEYCGFLVRECVQLGSKHRLTSWRQPPNLAYYNMSAYRDIPSYLNISEMYSFLPSVPRNSWGSCAFVASGSIRSNLGSIIDSHDTVVRISATNLSKYKLSRGCKTDVLLLKPHRKLYDNIQDSCKQNLKFYWEPSTVYTYGNPGKSMFQKTKHRNSLSPEIQEGVPIIRTIVDYEMNDELSPPYPLSDAGIMYVEKLFESLSVLSSTRIVPTSGFRFLVQLILSRRCSSLSVFGFSGLQESVYFRSTSNEKVNKWHNPEIEHSVLEIWDYFSSELNYKFKLYTDVRNN